ncbi:chloride channel protein [Vagococcus elongatus]|uniref:Voltage-gated chloride channel protein n=1 Tax=Vagococcus elongatus TaxID=180344 RepID=A0A430B1X5_9ENTE|nr:chloride channel protein [Vagococcus elongatus]RSU14308.1 voltage-gated chloride channel protein [Vagococcus elongatus]
MSIKFTKLYKLIYFILLSIVIGVVVGGIDALFGRVLISLSDFRVQHFMFLIPFLSVAGMIFLYFFSRFGEKSQKGMDLVFLAGHGEENEIPVRLIPFVMIGTWLAHLFGASVGREGVAVQLGATIANWFGRKLKLENHSSYLIVVGMAAGFAGLFGTPLAAAFFALEVLVVGRLKHEALLPALIAAYTASITSQSLGLEKFNVPLAASLQLDFFLFGKLVMLGIVFGLTGAAFARLLGKSKSFLKEKIPHSIIRIGVGGVVLTLSLMLLYQGRYSGLGTNLIEASFSNEKIYAYDWLLKMLLTILTVSVGFLGGEVTPLFSVGATLGVLLAHLTGLPIEFVAALGYASVFGGATRTLLAPIFIGGEVFGFQYLPYFIIVCSVAYSFSKNHSIYGLQKVVE